MSVRANRCRTDSGINLGGVPDIVLEWVGCTTEENEGDGAHPCAYEVYRGTMPDFQPDTEGFSNRIFDGTMETFTDVGSLSGGESYFYLVVSVDENGDRNEE